MLLTHRMLSIFAENVLFKIIFDQQVLPVLPHASGKQSLSPRLIFNNSLDNKKKMELKSLTLRTRKETKQWNWIIDIDFSGRKISSRWKIVASFKPSENRKHFVSKANESWRITFTLTHFINWHNSILAKIVLWQLNLNTKDWN